MSQFACVCRGSHSQNAQCRPSLHRPGATLSEPLLSEYDKTLSLWPPQEVMETTDTLFQEVNNQQCDMLNASQSEGRRKKWGKSQVSGVWLEIPLLDTESWRAAVAVGMCGCMCESVCVDWQAAQISHFNW